MAITYGGGVCHGDSLWTGDLFYRWGKSLAVVRWTSSAAQESDVSQTGWRRQNVCPPGMVPVYPSQAAPAEVPQPGATEAKPAEALPPEATTPSPAIWPADWVLRRDPWAL